MTAAQLAALTDLYKWATEANRRLEYERDRETGYQFGGNPYCNPVLKAAGIVLASLDTGEDDLPSVDEAGVWHALRPHAVLRVLRNGDWLSGPLRGESLLILNRWAETGESVAFGAFLDRLEEVPAECGLPAALVLTGVRWLRAANRYAPVE